MIGKYVGLPIGGVLSSNAFLVVNADGYNANGVASSNVITAADKNGNYALTGTGATNYQSSNFFSAFYQVSGTATADTTGNPYFNGAYTVTGLATVYGDGEAGGQAQYTVSAAATADATSTASKDAIFEAIGFAETDGRFGADAIRFGLAEGTSTASAIGTFVKTQTNKTGSLTKFNQITTARTTNTIITASNPKQKVITQELDAA